MAGASLFCAEVNLIRWMLTPIELCRTVRGAGNLPPGYRDAGLQRLAI